MTYVTMTVSVLVLLTTNVAFVQSAGKALLDNTVQDQRENRNSYYLKDDSSKNSSAVHAPAITSNATTQSAGGSVYVPRPIYRDDDDDDDDEEQRWNSSQFLSWLDQGGLRRASNRRQIQDFIGHVPRPTGEDVEIYNLDAWHRLRSLLGLERTSSRQEEVLPPPKICVSGGSVSAGGKVVPKERYDNRFVDIIYSAPSSDQEVVKSLQIVNHAHGNRGSAHTTMLMHSYLPSDANIIFWEFSPNDRKWGDCTQINNDLIFYLNQVERLYKDNPPMVVLIYLWNNPFSFQDEKERLIETTFQCHNRIGANYDFVVGSIHLGSYLSNLRWGLDTLQAHFTVPPDEIHPEANGHAMMAFLLWDLVSNEKRMPISPPLQTMMKEGNASNILKPSLSCDDRDPFAARVKYLIEDSFSQASWAGEPPINERHSPGMIYPYVFSTISTNKTLTMPEIVDRGKTIGTRNDRKISLILPCCHSGERLSFDLSRSEDAETISNGGRWISAINLYLGFEFDEASRDSIQVDVIGLDQAAILLNSSAAPAGFFSRTERSKTEKCRIGDRWLNTWFLLPEKAYASRIDFCDKGTHCPQKNRTASQTLAHVALF